MIRLRFVALGLVLIASLTRSFAAPLPTPLASAPDKLGAELQQSFISAPPDAAKERNGFIAYRKTFTLGTAPTTATLHLFGDVRYLVWLNGQPVHRGPNRFETRGPQYDSVNLAAALRPGENTLALVLMGNSSNARMMRHHPGLTLRLDADNRPVLRTDETWKWSAQTRYRPARVNWAHIIDRIDTRVEDGDWTQPGYDDRAWSPAVKLSGDSWGPLTARRIPLLRDTPVDFKFAGNTQLPVTLEAGQQIRLSAGRLVQAYTVLTLEADEGTQLTLNYTGIEYTAKAGRQVYISSDSYAFDAGAITVKSGKATIVDLKLVERLYPFDRVGRFKSNDPVLNKLWDVSARSLEILSEDAYVDCADRERAEWMDNDPPMFDVNRTAFAAPGPDGKPLYADARLMGEMLRRTALTLQPEGWVKAHTSSDRFDIHGKMEDRSCDWVQGARRYHESTGDLTLIREIWPVIVRQMDYFLERRSSRGLVIGREWVIWGNPLGYQTGEGAGLNAFVYKALVDAAYLGNALGDTKNAPRLAKEAAALAAAYNRLLWNEAEGTYYSGYATPKDELPPGVDNENQKFPSDWRMPPKPAMLPNRLLASSVYPALFALDQDIVPPERRARVTRYLLAQPDPKPRIMFYYYYWKQLYAADEPARDRFIIETMRQKWKTMAESPWQTTWEEFGVGSKAHCYGMFPGYYLSAYVLGVRPVMPASAKRLLINPRLGDLTSAEGTVVTEFGLVPVSWKRTDTELTFEFTVPADVTSALQLPAFDGRAQLVLDGQPVAPPPAGQKNFTARLTPGVHRGTLTFPAGSYGAAPSPAARPAASPLRDDFTGPNPAWAPASGSWAAQAGTYRQSEASSLAVTGLKSGTWADATYTFTIALDQPNRSSNWAGFQFRKPSPQGTHTQGGYLVYLRQNGTLELFNGRVLQSAQTGLNPATPVRLKVVAAGSRLQVFIEDEATPRIDITDTAFADGYIGFTTLNATASFGPLSVTPAPVP